jgi:NAD(P)-dependent dehydrogenase (short-subunit alcohol dehydrogenase family)
MELLAKEGTSMVELESIAKEAIPSGRLQTNEDMAYGVIYLLSDESSQVTGTDLHITGDFNL